jgi:N-methylhydantoinase B/oxoprolinase/acetone carboxylase alpha subunit
MTDTCDPVTLEIVRGALRAAQSEMEALIERTAMSPFIREKKDYFTAFFDARGKLVYIHQGGYRREADLAADMRRYLRAQ